MFQDLLTYSFKANAYKIFCYNAEGLKKKRNKKKKGKKLSAKRYSAAAQKKIYFTQRA